MSDNKFAAYIGTYRQRGRERERGEREFGEQGKRERVKREHGEKERKRETEREGEREIDQVT